MSDRLGGRGQRGEERARERGERRTRRDGLQECRRCGLLVEGWRDCTESASFVSAAGESYSYRSCALRTISDEHDMKRDGQHTDIDMPCLCTPATQRDPRKVNLVAIVVIEIYNSHHHTDKWPSQRTTYRARFRSGMRRGLPVIRLTRVEVGCNRRPTVNCAPGGRGSTSNFRRS